MNILTRQGAAGVRQLVSSRLASTRAMSTRVRFALARVFFSAFPSDRPKRKKKKKWQRSLDVTWRWRSPARAGDDATQNAGIAAMEAYVPRRFVEQSELEQFDGVSAGKYTKGARRVGCAQVGG